MTETAWGGPTSYNEETGDDAADTHPPGRQRVGIEFVHPGEEDTFSPNGERPMRFAKPTHAPDSISLPMESVAHHDPID